MLYRVLHIVLVAATSLTLAPSISLVIIIDRSRTIHGYCACAAQRANVAGRIRKVIPAESAFSACGSGSSVYLGVARSASHNALQINPRRMRSVCLCVCVSATILALQATRRDTNSFSATGARKCGDFAETTAFERYGVKTSEKANNYA